MLVMFNSVKLCYFACLKYLIGPIKILTVNSKAGEKIGEAGRQREQIKEKAKEIRSNKRRGQSTGQPQK